MAKKAGLWGIIAAILLVFGVLVKLFIPFAPSLIANLHFGFSGLFLLLFILNGGLKLLGCFAFTSSRRVKSALSLLVLLLIIILSNLCLNRYLRFSWDLTRDKSYTLSDRSQQILKQMPGKVEVLAFYLGGRIDPEVRDLLELFSQESVNFHWRVVDPERELALSTASGISRSGTIRLIYFIGKDAERTFNLTQKLGEEELINAVNRLVKEPARKVIYQLRGHGEPDISYDGEGGFSEFKRSIEAEGAIVKELFLIENSLIPSDAASLLVLCPQKELSQLERDEISMFLHRGGNAVLFSAPLGNDDIRQIAAQVGIEIGRDVIVDQIINPFKGPELGVQPLITAFNTEHPITKSFTEPLILSVTSSVKALSHVPAQREVVELAFTKKGSWGEKNLGAIFSNRPQAVLEPEDIPGPVPVVAASKGEKGRVVAFGGCDFLANINIRQYFNRDFVLNAVNWTSSAEEQIVLRKKEPDKAIKLVDPELYFVVFVIAALVIPELILAIGITVWWFRRY